eukprot:scaffold1166_cov261-Pinguiococcus_pyrenoidosus.AAC.58
MEDVRSPKQRSALGDTLSGESKKKAAQSGCVRAVPTHGVHLRGLRGTFLRLSTLLSWSLGWPQRPMTAQSRYTAVASPSRKGSATP